MLCTTQFSFWAIFCERDQRYWQCWVIGRDESVRAATSNKYLSSVGVIISLISLLIIPHESIVPKLWPGRYDIVCCTIPPPY